MRLENITIDHDSVSGYFRYGIHSVIPGGGARTITVIDNDVRAVRPRAAPAGLFSTGIDFTRGNSNASTPGEGTPTLASNTFTANGGADIEGCY